MKKLLIAGATAFACAVIAGPASAEDNTFGPEPSFDWSGFYLGLQGGYAWSKDDWEVGNVSFDSDGMLLGGTAGFNGDTGSWVFGAEADISWADVSGEQSGCGIGGACETKMEYFGTFRGRLGYDLGSVDQGLLVYGTGGIAMGGLNYKSAGGGEDFNTGTGWVLGGGVETTFGETSSAKLEYLHYELEADATLSTAAFNPNTKGDIVRAGYNFRF